MSRYSGDSKDYLNAQFPVGNGVFVRRYLMGGHLKKEAHHGVSKNVKISTPMHFKELHVQ